MRNPTDDVLGTGWGTRIETTDTHGLICVQGQWLTIYIDMILTTIIFIFQPMCVLSQPAD